MDRPIPKDLFPHSGARPEILTVFDMRGDNDPGDRLLAKSAQGLMNSDQLRTDKIYLIFNDEDARLLDWLVSEQYVLSTGTMHDMEELIRREPIREGIFCDPDQVDIAAAIAGSERMLIITDPSVAKRHDIERKIDLRRKWQTQSEGIAWLMRRYEKKINRRIVMFTKDGDLSNVDYQVANNVLAFDVDGEAAQISNMLVNEFPANIPCLAQSQSGAIDDEAMKLLNSAAKIPIPLDGLSNLSLWTSFHPLEQGFEEINSGAVHHVHAVHVNDLGYAKHLSTQWTSGTAWTDAIAMNIAVVLRQLAPPLFDGLPTPIRTLNPGNINDFRLGVISESEYGSAYGPDRQRIWNAYLDLSRKVFQVAAGG